MVARVPQLPSFMRRLLLLVLLGVLSGAPGVASSALAQPGPGHAVATPLSLAEVVRLARDSATASRVAASGARIARAATGLAATGLLPFVSLDASGTRLTQNLATFGFPGPSTASDPFNVFATGVRVRQTVLDVAAWQRVAAQRDSARAATADAAAARDGAVTQAAARYLVTLAADASLAGRLADSTVAAAVLRDVTARRAVGEATDIDVTRATLGVSAAAMRVTDARATARQARFDLAVALAQPLERVDQLLDSLRSPAPEDKAAVPSESAPITQWQALGIGRPDVRASVERRRFASSLRRASTLEYLPQVTLLGEYQATGVETSALPTVYRYGVQVSLPVLDGFSRWRRRSLDQERERIATTLQRDLSLRAEREIRGAAVELERTEAAARVAEQQLALALTELQQARDRVRAGLGSSLETTQALAAVVTAREGLIGARLQYHLARLEWHRATATLDALH